jgi:hypothetical protein
MNKKIAQQNTIDFKRDEINRAVNDALTNLNTKMQAATRQLNEQITKELNTIVTNLSKEVETKVNEIKSLIPVAPAQQGTTADLDLPGVVKESGKKKKQKKKQKRKSKHSIDEPMDHPLPRDTEDTDGLPPFWRRNFDYGESPYMNIGFIEKITDKPPIKKKRKKSEVLTDLIILADQLDEAGLMNAANRIDNIIKEAVEKWEYYGLEPPKEDKPPQEKWQYHGFRSPEEYEAHLKMRGIEPEQKQVEPQREEPSWKKTPSKQDIDKIYKRYWPQINEFFNIIGDFRLYSSGLRQDWDRDEIIVEYSSWQEKEKAREYIEAHGFNRSEALPRLFRKDLSDGVWLQLTEDGSLEGWADRWDSSIGVLPDAPPAPKPSIEISIHQNNSDTDGRAFYSAVEQSIDKNFTGIEKRRNDDDEEEEGYDIDCKNCGLTQVNSPTPYCYNCGQKAGYARW